MLPVCCVLNQQIHQPLSCRGYQRHFLTSLDILTIPPLLPTLSVPHPSLLPSSQAVAGTPGHRRALSVGNDLAGIAAAATATPELSNLLLPPSGLHHSASDAAMHRQAAPVPSGGASAASAGVGASRPPLAPSSRARLASPPRIVEAEGY